MKKATELPPVVDKPEYKAVLLLHGFAPDTMRRIAHERWECDKGDFRRYECHLSAGAGDVHIRLYLLHRGRVQDDWSRDALASLTLESPAEFEILLYQARWIKKPAA
jgi:hypothetical protein